MSQQQVFNDNSIPGVPNIEYVQGNDGVDVGPDPTTHVIKILGDTTKGTYSSGDAGTYTETIINPYFYQGIVSTTDDTATLLDIDIPVASDSAMSIRANIVAYDSANGIGLAGELIAGIRNVAGVLTIIGIPDRTINADGALVGCTFTLTSSGTNAKIQVQGVIGHSLNWKSNIDIVSVS